MNRERREAFESSVLLGFMCGAILGFVGVVLILRFG